MLSLLIPYCLFKFAKLNGKFTAYSLKVTQYFFSPWGREKGKGKRGVGGY